MLVYYSPLKKRLTKLLISLVGLLVKKENGGIFENEIYKTITRFLTDGVNTIDGNLYVCRGGN